MKRAGTTLLFVAAVLLASACRGGTAPSPGTPAAHTATPIPWAAATAVATPGLPGTIEGSLSYPASGIPPDLYVCAEPVAGGAAAAICTHERIRDARFRYGQGYRVEVPPGDYVVYSLVPGTAWKGYYTAFMRCGATYACRDEPSRALAVTVRSGETLKGIDPGDLLNRLPNTPAPPPPPSATATMRKGTAGPGFTPTPAP